MRLSLSSVALAATVFLSSSSAAPTERHSPLLNPNYGPIPNESPLYNRYRGTKAPFPATHTKPLPAITSGAPGPDDLLFQNLLSAEWIIYAFYQTAVEMFNASSFTTLGLPNNTYSRIQEIRDNEAGHLRIFQDQISDASVKPGPCKYDYGFTKPEEFTALVVDIEIGSMIFLTGLIQEAKLEASKGALVAIAEVESRHETWSLIDLFGANPFGGPSDTSYPYANQLLDVTNQFVVPGSCPAANPVYPSPRQNLPQITPKNATAPGQEMVVEFTQKDNQPTFQDGKTYSAVFFHGLHNISAPFDTKTGRTKMPGEFESGKGAIVLVIADEEGAPTMESCVAGPAVILQQPHVLQQLDV